MAAAEFQSLQRVLRQFRLRHVRNAALTMAVVTLPPSALLSYWIDSLLFGLLPIVAVAVAAILAYRSAGRRLHLWLDDACTALQDSSFLLEQDTAPDSVARLQQQRVRQQLLTHLEQAAKALPPVLPRYAYAISAGVAVALALLIYWPAKLTVPVSADVESTPTPASIAVQIAVTPPRYTGLSLFNAGSGDVDVPDGSELSFCLVAAPSDDLSTVTVQWLDGETRPLVEQHIDGVQQRCTTWTFGFSTAYRISRAGEELNQLRGRLLLRADRPPELRIAQPEREVLEVDSQQYVLDLQLQVTDDYGLHRASLHWTLARGGGENVRFTDREQRLPAGKQSGVWDYQQTIRLRQLGMEPGDELYFYLVAEDNRVPERQQSRTRTYILRHPVEQAGSEAGARLPADLGKAKFRSQRQIILDTEALISQRKQLSPLEFRARSEKLAQDQMVLRLRYGEFLGEESSFEAASEEPAADETEAESHGHEGEHHEGEHAEGGMAPVGIAARAQVNVLTAYGHAHDEAENATLFDEATKAVLRRALSAMWAAEGGLRMSTPEEALPHEYDALKAIKELQQAERIYLHKTAFSPPPLEDSMRFSGEAIDLRSLQRQHQFASDDDQQLLQRVVAQLNQTGLTAEQMATADRAAMPLWLQKTLRSADAEQQASVLALLASWQDWQTGCKPCRPALRDRLVNYLGRPLPAAQAQSQSTASGVLQRRLQTLLPNAPTAAVSTPHD